MNKKATIEKRSVHGKAQEERTEKVKRSKKLSEYGKQLEEKQKVKAKKEAAMLAEINKVIAVLKESPVKVTAKTGTSGKIFGSITSLQIARAIRDQKGYEIDRKRIHIVNEVKELGTYKATIDFGNNNHTEVEFEVVSE